MKQLIYKIWIGSILVWLASCSADDTIWQDKETAGLKLRLTGGILLANTSRAEVEDTDMERALSHLDVFFFDTKETNPASVIHRRITNFETTGNQEEGTVRLDVDLDDFVDRTHNRVYVKANATTDLSDVQTLQQLKDKVQTD